MRKLQSKLFPNCELPESGDIGFYDRIPNGFHHEVYLYLSEETVADHTATEKAAEFFDKAPEWDVFCRKTFLSFEEESAEHKTVKEYFDCYKEEIPEAFGAEDVSALTLTDMINLLKFKSMASHGSGEEQSFIVDFTLGYDQILCVKFNIDEKVDSIAWES